MRKAFLITFFITILSAACLQAVPVYPGKIKVTQPDGSTRYILKHGDEWGHWTTDLQGRVVRKDAEGWWRPTGESVEAVRQLAGSLVTHTLTKKMATCRKARCMTSPSRQNPTTGCLLTSIRQAATRPNTDNTHGFI